jgi:transposase-like protein
MHRIPPSQKIGKKFEQLMNQGLDGEEDVTSMVVRLGIERVVQEMVEQEVTDYLERGHYQRRRPEQEHRGYRNGYEPGRIRTAEGEIVVQVPQVRDAPETYRSRLMTFLRGNSDVLERLAVEMYARGLSTRDIEDALEEATGDRLLSRTAVSQITEVLWDEYEAFAERDLSGFEVEYLFLDAVYESLRQQGGGKEGVLCAWAICADGRKVMLHLALGNYSVIPVCGGTTASASISTRYASPTSGACTKVLAGRISPKRTPWARATASQSAKSRTYRRVRTTSSKRLPSDCSAPSTLSITKWS